MRILILVLSYDDGGIYSGLKQAQQETWDSLFEHMGQSTFYYTGKQVVWGQKYMDRRMTFEHKNPCSDEYYLMHWKFKLCLDLIHEKGWNYDFVFRTNSSSYVNKKRLLHHAETLPRERCYSGWSLGEKEAVSGAGIWLSPDMVDILREEIPAGEQVEEDILIGRILHQKHGVEIIDDRSRFDVTDVDAAPLDRYHFRFKSPDRLQDIRNMYSLHKRIIK